MPTPAPKTTASPATLGQGIPLPAGKASVVQVVNPKPGSSPGTAATATAGAGKSPPRPGYTGGPEDPPGAPSVLEYEQTNVILKDLPDDQIRKWIRKVQAELDDLGLNRGSGAADFERLNPRAEAYLDIVTWDAANRNSYRDSTAQEQSSCGMFIRNLWWLCGIRGAKLMNEPYRDGIFTHLLKMTPGLRITYNKDVQHPTAGAGNWKTNEFLPGPGDVILLYQPGGSQHIFSIMDIDKDITLEDGKPMIRDKDGKPAKVINFYSIDGGQADGGGQNSQRKHQKSWGCHATKEVTRSMTLKEGRWPAVTVNWPIPNKAPGRPISAWIPILSLREMFTAPLILPRRKSRPNAPGSPGSGVTGAVVEPHADASDPVSQHKEWDSMVADNYAKSMPDLLDVFASAGYKKTLDVRNWYASPDNPKRELYGLRPQVAMDAILHRNEGESAQWILSECELAGIRPPKYADQYDLIKSTIGIRNIA